MMAILMLLSLLIEYWNHRRLIKQKAMGDVNNATSEDINLAATNVPVHEIDYLARKIFDDKNYHDLTVLSDPKRLMALASSRSCFANDTDGSLLRAVQHAMNDLYAQIRWLTEEMGDGEFELCFKTAEMICLLAMANDDQLIKIKCRACVKGKKVWGPKHEREAGCLRLRDTELIDKYCLRAFRTVLATRAQHYYVSQMVEDWEYREVRDALYIGFHRFVPSFRSLQEKAVGRKLCPMCSMQCDTATLKAEEEDLREETEN